jgi:hypothetical protein
LESARNIRARIQTALIREDRAGNDANYSKYIAADNNGLSPNIFSLQDACNSWTLLSTG